MQIASAVAGALVLATAFPPLFFQTTFGLIVVNNMTFALFFAVLIGYLHTEIINTEKEMNPKKEKKQDDELMEWQKSLGLVLLAVLICAFFFYYAPNSNSSLSLQVKNPAIWQFFTASFIHQNEIHLLGNMFVFVIAALFQIYIAEKSDRSRIFFKSLAVIILLIPIIDSLFQKFVLTAILPNYQASMGFSGVAAATLGLIPFTIFSYLYSKGLSRNFSKEFMWAAALLNSTFYFLIYATKSGILFLYIFFILAIAGFLYLVLKDKKRFFETIDIVKNEKDRLLWGALAAATIIFVIFAPLILYPENFVQGNNFTDFLTHAISLMAGIFIGYFAFELDTPANPKKTEAR